MDNSDDARENTGLRLRRRTILKLDETANRLGVSRATVVEALTWQCADHLKPITLDPAAVPPDHRGKKGQGRRRKGDGK